jgi:putative two-component system response regulator
MDQSDLQLAEKKRPKILLVDDEPANLRVLNQTLNSLYRLRFAKSGNDALAAVDKDKPDLVLLDVMMPDMTGFEVCKRLKSSSKTKDIPVIFVTALNQADDETQGFDVGAVDFITKPITPAVVKARVATHLSLVNVDELRRTRLQIIQRLGRASEYKDNETGMHIIRMSHYSKALSMAYGFDEEQADDLFHAAPMHDIGKIGIPDSIMLKPGKLNDEEFTIMKTHPEIGAEILGESDSDLIELAKIVSLTHHEKWDGSGYPKGLTGTDIPIHGRIVALTDVFDALTSKRPYKEAWSVDKALAFIHEQKGKHFDPELVTLFDSILPEILDIRDRWQDE